MIVCDPRVALWVAERCGCILPSAGVTAIGWLSGDKLTAGVMYEEFTEASIHATIAADGYLAKEFLRVIFDYPFNQLGVDKIIVQISEGNKPSVVLAQRLGFELEARIKGAYLDGDRLIYTMPAEKCNWLKRLENEQESKDTESA